MTKPTLLERVKEAYTNLGDNRIINAIRTVYDIGEYTRPGSYKLINKRYSGGNFANPNSNIWKRLNWHELYDKEVILTEQGVFLFFVRDVMSEREFNSIKQTHRELQNADYNTSIISDNCAIITPTNNIQIKEFRLRLVIQDDRMPLHSSLIYNTNEFNETVSLLGGQLQAEIQTITIGTNTFYYKPAYGFTPSTKQLLAGWILTTSNMDDPDEVVAYAPLDKYDHANHPDKTPAGWYWNVPNSNGDFAFFKPKLMNLNIGNGQKDYLVLEPTNALQFQLAPYGRVHNNSYPRVIEDKLFTNILTGYCRDTGTRHHYYNDGVNGSTTAATDRLLNWYKNGWTDDTKHALYHPRSTTAPHNKLRYPCYSLDNITNTSHEPVIAMVNDMLHRIYGHVNTTGKTLMDVMYKIEKRDDGLYLKRNYDDISSVLNQPGFRTFWDLFKTYEEWERIAFELRERTITVAFAQLEVPCTFVTNLESNTREEGTVTINLVNNQNKLHFPYIVPNGYYEQNKYTPLTLKTKGARHQNLIDGLFWDLFNNLKGNPNGMGRGDMYRFYFPPIQQAMLSHWYNYYLMGPNAIADYKHYCFMHSMTADKNYAHPKYYLPVMGSVRDTLNGQNFDSILPHMISSTVTYNTDTRIINVSNRFMTLHLDPSRVTLKLYTQEEYEALVEQAMNPDENVRIAYPKSNVLDEMDYHIGKIGKNYPTLASILNRTEAREAIRRDPSLIRHVRKQHWRFMDGPLYIFLCERDSRNKPVPFGANMQVPVFMNRNGYFDIGYTQLTRKGSFTNSIYGIVSGRWRSGTTQFGTFIRDRGNSVGMNGSGDGSASSWYDKWTTLYRPLPGKTVNGINHGNINSQTAFNPFPVFGHAAMTPQWNDAMLRSMIADPDVVLTGRIHAHMFGSDGDVGTSFRQAIMYAEDITLGHAAKRQFECGNEFRHNYICFYFYKNLYKIDNRVPIEDRPDVQLLKQDRSAIGINEIPHRRRWCAPVMVSANSFNDNVSAYPLLYTGRNIPGEYYREYNYSTQAIYVVNQQQHFFPIGFQLLNMVDANNFANISKSSMNSMRTAYLNTHPSDGVMSSANDVNNHPLYGPWSKTVNGQPGLDIRWTNSYIGINLWDSNLKLSGLQRQIKSVDNDPDGWKYTRYHDPLALLDGTIIERPIVGGRDYRYSATRNYWKEAFDATGGNNYGRAFIDRPGYWRFSRGDHPWNAYPAGVETNDLLQGSPWTIYTPVESRQNKNASYREWTRRDHPNMFGVELYEPLNGHRAYTDCYPYAVSRIMNAPEIWLNKVFRYFWHGQWGALSAILNSGGTTAEFNIDTFKRKFAIGNANDDYIMTPNNESWNGLIDWCVHKWIEVGDDERLRNTIFYAFFELDMRAFIDVLNACYRERPDIFEVKKLWITNVEDFMTKVERSAANNPNEGPVYIAPVTDLTTRYDYTNADVCYMSPYGGQAEHSSGKSLTRAYRPPIPQIAMSSWNSGYNAQKFIAPSMASLYNNQYIKNPTNASSGSGGYLCSEDGTSLVSYSVSLDHAGASNSNPDYPTSVSLSGGTSYFGTSTSNAHEAFYHSASMYTWEEFIAAGNRLLTANERGNTKAHLPIGIRNVNDAEFLNKYDALAMVLYATGGAYTRSNRDCRYVLEPLFIQYMRDGELHEVVDEIMRGFFKLDGSATEKQAVIDMMKPTVNNRRNIKNHIRDYINRNIETVRAKYGLESSNVLYQDFRKFFGSLYQDAWILEMIKMYNAQDEFDIHEFMRNRVTNNLGAETPIESKITDDIYQMGKRHYKNVERQLSRMTGGRILLNKQYQDKYFYLRPIVDFFTSCLNISSEMNNENKWDVPVYLRWNGKLVKRLPKVLTGCHHNNGNHVRTANGLDSIYTGHNCAYVPTVADTGELYNAFSQNTSRQPEARIASKVQWYNPYLWTPFSSYFLHPYKNPHLPDVVYKNIGESLNTFGLISGISPLDVLCTESTTYYANKYEPSSGSYNFNNYINKVNGNKNSGEYSQNGNRMISFCVNKLFNQSKNITTRDARDYYLWYKHQNNNDQVEYGIFMDGSGIHTQGEGSLLPTMFPEFDTIVPDSASRTGYRKLQLINMPVVWKYNNENGATNTVNNTSTVISRVYYCGYPLENLSLIDVVVRSTSNINRNVDLLDKIGPSNRRNIFSTVVRLYLKATSNSNGPQINSFEYNYNYHRNDSSMFVQNVSWDHSMPVEFMDSAMFYKPFMIGLGYFLLTRLTDKPKWRGYPAQSFTRISENIAWIPTVPSLMAIKFNRDSHGSNWGSYINDRAWSRGRYGLKTDATMLVLRESTNDTNDNARDIDHQWLLTDLEPSCGRNYSQDNLWDSVYTSDHDSKLREQTVFSINSPITTIANPFKVGRSEGDTCWITGHLSAFQSSGNFGLNGNLGSNTQYGGGIITTIPNGKNVNSVKNQFLDNVQDIKRLYGTSNDLGEMFKLSSDQNVGFGYGFIASLFATPVRETSPIAAAITSHKPASGPVRVRNQWENLIFNSLTVTDSIWSVSRPIDPSMWMINPLDYTAMNKLGTVDLGVPMEVVLHPYMNAVPLSPISQINHHYWIITDPRNYVETTSVDNIKAINNIKYLNVVVADGNGKSTFGNAANSSNGLSNYIYPYIDAASQLVNTNKWNSANNISDAYKLIGDIKAVNTVRHVWHLNAPNPNTMGGWIQSVPMYPMAISNLTKEGKLSERNWYLFHSNSNITEWLKPDVKNQINNDTYHPATSNDPTQSIAVPLAMQWMTQTKLEQYSKDGTPAAFGKLYPSWYKLLYNHLDFYLTFPFHKNGFKRKDRSATSTWSNRGYIASPIDNLIQLMSETVNSHFNLNIHRSNTKSMLLGVWSPILEKLPPHINRVKLAKFLNNNLGVVGDVNSKWGAEHTFTSNPYINTMTAYQVLATFTNMLPMPSWTLPTNSNANTLFGNNAGLLNGAIGAAKLQNNITEIIVNYCTRNANVINNSQNPYSTEYRLRIIIAGILASIIHNTIAVRPNTKKTYSVNGLTFMKPVFIDDTVIDVIEDILLNGTDVTNKEHSTFRLTNEERETLNYMRFDEYWLYQPNLFSNIGDDYVDDRPNRNIKPAIDKIVSLVQILYPALPAYQQFADVHKSAYYHHFYSGDSFIAGRFNRPSNNNGHVSGIRQGLKMYHFYPTPTQVNLISNANREAFINKYMGLTLAEFINEIQNYACYRSIANDSGNNVRLDWNSDDSCLFLPLECVHLLASLMDRPRKFKNQSNQSSSGFYEQYSYDMYRRPDEQSTYCPCAVNSSNDKIIYITHFWFYNNVPIFCFYTDSMATAIHFLHEMSPRAAETQGQRY